MHADGHPRSLVPSATMSELMLFTDSTWMCPACFHVLVALEEKRLAYELQPLRPPLSAEHRAQLQARGTAGTVPVLVHRRHDAPELWISESLAISEYLAEQFPTPGHPRLFPAALDDRARARQVMSFVRTGTSALRDERPTSSVFGRPVSRPLSDAARAQAATLIGMADRMLGDGPSLFGAWCIADADLALALMRLIANQDAVPARLVTYALAQWDRPSVRKYVAHLPTSH